MTKYEGVTCKVKISTRNPFGGAKATCIRDPKCWAVEERGSKASYCKGRKGGHIYTRKEGMVNLKEEDGKVVWIKGKHYIHQGLGKITLCKTFIIEFLELKYSKCNFLTDHCADKIQNQDETGVDCGGVCAKAC